MSRPNDFGGGGEVAGQVSALSSEIEDLIGQLRGVEDSWRQLVHPAEWWTDLDSQGMTAGTWLVEQTFQVRGDYGFEVDYEIPSGEGLPSEQSLQDSTQAAMDSAFNAAKGSGAGALDHARSVLTQVIEPDQAQLASSAYAIDDVALWLYSFTTKGAPAFVTKLRASWPPSALASESFYDFYDDLGDVCAHYYIGAAQLAGATAAVSRIVRAYQENLVEVLEAGRDQLIAALKAWQAGKGPEQVLTITREGGTDAAAVLGGVSLALGIIGLIPGAGLPAGAASVAAGVLSYSVDDGTEKVQTQILTVATADDIAGSINDAMISLRDEMAEALDAVGARGGDGTPSFNRFVNEAVRNPNWEPVKVDLS